MGSSLTLTDQIVAKTYVFHKAVWKGTHVHSEEDEGGDETCADLHSSTLMKEREHTHQEQLPQPVHQPTIYCQKCSQSTDHRDHQGRLTCRHTPTTVNTSDISGMFLASQATADGLCTYEEAGFERVDEGPV